MEIDSEERPLLAKGPSVNHKRLCSILPCLLLSGALVFGPFYVVNELFRFRFV
jgi:hypothetical protein